MPVPPTPSSSACSGCNGSATIGIGPRRSTASTAAGRAARSTSCPRPTPRGPDSARGALITPRPERHRSRMSTATPRWSPSAACPPAASSTAPSSTTSTSASRAEHCWRSPPTCPGAAPMPATPRSARRSCCPTTSTRTAPTSSAPSTPSKDSPPETTGPRPPDTPRAPSPARHDPIDLPLDRTTRAFVARLEADEAPPLDHLTLDQARAGLPALQRLAPLQPPPPPPHAPALPVGPTGYVQLRIVRPPQRSGMLPGVVYGHGGG